MPKKKNKNKKSRPKAQFQIRKPGESLWEYFMRQVEHREKELKAIDEKRAAEGDKNRLMREEEVQTADENFDKRHAQAILFAALGVNKDVAKILRKVKGKVKNIPEKTRDGIIEFHEKFEEYTTLTEKGYIDTLRQSNKDINAAMGEVEVVVNRHKLTIAAEGIKENISFEALHKADELYDALHDLALKRNFTLYLEANDIEVSFDLRYNSDYTTMKREITTMLAYGCMYGGHGLVSASEPAYKDEKETQYFTFFKMGDNDFTELSSEENEKEYINFHDGAELDPKVDYVFSTLSDLMAMYDVMLYPIDEI